MIDTNKLRDAVLKYCRAVALQGNQSHQIVDIIVSLCDEIDKLSDCTQCLEDLYRKEREVTKSYGGERITEEPWAWTFYDQFDKETELALTEAKRSK